MQITVSDDLAAAARLAELSSREAQRAWIIGLFAEQRLTLTQAAELAGLDEADFQRHLALCGVAAAAGEAGASSKNVIEPPSDKPWMVLRGSACYVGDPFVPAVSEEEIVALQRQKGEVSR